MIKSTFKGTIISIQPRIRLARFFDESFHTYLSYAITWMDEMGAHTKTVSVAVGNEKAFSFYERFGFYPRKTLLEQIK